MVAETIRKLTIWHTPTFTPILTHDELDPILSTLGFHPLPPATAAAGDDSTATVWQEYSFSAAGVFVAGSSAPPPRLRLPYPRIDGSHVETYRSFFEVVDLYLRMDNISDLFHVRGMPLQLDHDRHHKWLHTTADDFVYVYRNRHEKWLHTTGDDFAYVYREGTVNLTTANKNADQDHNRRLHFVPWENIVDDKS